MRAGPHAIEIEAQIILSRRELAVLNHICSYDHTDYFKGLVSTHYEGGVTRDEMKELMENLRSETSKLMVRIQSSKEQLFGSQQTKTPSTLGPVASPPDLEAARKLTH